MIIITAAVVILALLLSYSNGANDVSRGIATIVGAGVDKKRALIWGSIWTGVGSMLSFLVATAMLKTFTKGWINESIVVDNYFAIAVALGAVVWIMIASRVGLPVSTTHSLTGAIIGSGAIAYGTSNIKWGLLLTKIGLPLIASPFIVLAVTFVLYKILFFLLTSNRQAATEVAATAEAVAGSAPAEKHAPTRLGLDIRKIHWISSALTSAARGLNDTPKIAAIAAFAFLSGISDTNWMILGFCFALAMTVGSYFGGKKVTETMGFGVTDLKNEADGTIANIITAAFVMFGAKLGIPLSTTHVSNGAIAAVGLRRGMGGVDWHTLRNFILAWVTTLPITAIIAVVVYLIVSAIA